MKKTVKRIISVMISLLLLMSAFTVIPASAEIPREYAGKYVKEIALAYSEHSRENAEDYIRRCCEIPILKDLNNNAKFDIFEHETFVYMGCNTTNDPDAAITGMIIMRGPERDPQQTCYINGIMYYLANSGVDSYVAPRLNDDGAVDLNMNTKGEHIYLYVTKDKNAGAPMTSLDVFSGKYEQDCPYYNDRYNPDHGIVSWDDRPGEPADLNSDARGDFIFIIYEREHKHTPVTVKGYPATCTTDGLTDGTRCSVCGETITAQQVIPANGHTDKNSDYLCDICGSRMPALKYVSAISLVYSALNDKTEAAERAKYLIDNSCGVPLYVDLNSGCHMTENPYVIYMGYNTTDYADYAITGLIAVHSRLSGSTPFTSPKNYITVDGIRYYLVNSGYNRVVPMLSEDGAVDLNMHSGGGSIYLYATNDKAAGAPITEVNVIASRDEGIIRQYGSGHAVCWSDSTNEPADMNKDAGGDYVYIVYERAKEHVTVIDKAVEATCTEAGLTQGSHCAVCGTVITAQKPVAAKGHIDSDDDAFCDVCGTQVREQTFIERIISVFRRLINLLRSLFG